jgi:hypothetical protein
VFGGVPSKIMVDNLKSAVLQRLAGVAPVINARYTDFARHYGFSIAPCNVARANEKGRVESGVGYVKKNFLRGLELTEFRAIQAAAEVWLDTIANVRIHGETHQRPVDLFAQERPHLQPLNENRYDVARTATARASSQFRITLDTNRYSVPAAYAHRRLTVKAYPDRVCIYFDAELIARHQRSYARHHVRKILALAEIYPPDEVARAISDGLAFAAFSAEYIANILETRARTLPEPGPLQLTRGIDLLDIDIPTPDLTVYDGGSRDAE